PAVSDRPACGAIAARPPTGRPAARGRRPWQKHSSAIRTAARRPPPPRPGAPARFRRETIPARNTLRERHLFFQRAPDLAVPLDDKDARLVARAAVAQLHELFHARILQAGDFLRWHGRFMNHKGTEDTEKLCFR